MKTRKAQPGGWMLAEVLTSLAIVGMLLTGLGLALGGLKRFNAFQLLRQQCLAAGQAQLDSIAATGQPITREDLARLWPGLSAQLDRSAGQGDWAGLTLVKVSTAGTTDYRKKVTLTLSRYIAAGQER